MFYFYLVLVGLCLFLITFLKIFFILNEYSFIYENNTQGRKNKQHLQGSCLFKESQPLGQMMLQI